jgi:thiamine kinase-like enzyme
MRPIDKVLALRIWKGTPEAEVLGGGITNLNFKVRDGRGLCVVRVGDDIPVHQILRFNEVAASRAAFLAGVSPEVLHHEPGILVIDHVEGKTLTGQDLCDGAWEEALALVIRAHREMPRHLRGASLTFWVFHVIRDYLLTLREGQSRHLALLPELGAEAEALERAVGPIEMVYGHNDLLPANFILGSRMWLVDWDYAGWGSPLFDLGGLAANAGLAPDQEEAVLRAYYGRLDRDLMERYRAMKAAAALREALWSMVSEIHSKLDFDYAAYTAKCLITYAQAQDARRQI